MGRPLRAVAAGVPVPVVRAPRQPASARSRSGAVQVTRVHPWVWAIGMIVADGDAYRITIESETTVVLR